MKAMLFAAGLLSISLSVLAAAQAADQPGNAGTKPSPMKIKEQESKAHTAEQFDQLARYYSNQQQVFLLKAADEKEEWNRRSQHTSSLSAKYPKPADSARNLYEYYTKKAADSALSAGKYAHLASSPTLAAKP